MIAWNSMTTAIAGIPSFRGDLYITDITTPANSNSRIIAA